jgi:hypothetical protein
MKRPEMNTLTINQKVLNGIRPSPQTEKVNEPLEDQNDDVARIFGSSGLCYRRNSSV